MNVIYLEEEVAA